MPTDPVLPEGEETDEPLGPEGGEGEAAGGEAQAEATAQAAPAKPDLWDLVSRHFDGQALDEDIPGVTDTFSEDDLKELDPRARVALRAVLGKYKAREAELAEKAKLAEAPIKEREEKLAAREAAHLREVAKYRSMASSPRVRELLAKPAPKDDPSIDPFTREGQLEIAARHQAEAMRPFHEDALRAEREALINDFVQANAWARDEALQKRALALVEERNKGLTKEDVQAGKGITGIDALNLAHAEAIIAGQETRKAAQVRSSQASAAKVARATSPSTVAAPEVPKGLKGAAYYRFLEANPDVQRHLQRQRGAA